MRTILLVGVMAGFAMGQSKSPQLPTDNPLVGRWELQKVLRGDTPDNDLVGAVREFKADGKYSITAAPGKPTPPLSGRYTVDATKTPPHIDMIPSSGRYMGRTLKGVYKLSGESLILNFSEPDQPRPTDTEPKPNRTRTVHRKLK